jgi:hypothetical protein
MILEFALPCGSYQRSFFFLSVKDPDFGYTEGYWSVADVHDGVYEISLFAKCVSSGMAFPPPGLDDYRSPAITGVIDRSAPVQFGPAQPLTTKYSLGDDISISFNEEIDCAMPFKFDVQFALVDINTNASASIPDGFVVSCKKYVIMIALSTSAAVSNSV